LRRNIKQYYLTYGQDDPVVIEIPKGTYVPVFSTPEPKRANPVLATTARAKGIFEANNSVGASTILVVDDEPQVEALITQGFRRKVRDGKISFLFAKDGEEAVDILLSGRPVNLILTDINMPKMDGLALLDHLDQIDPLLVAVVVSAYGDMDNIRTAMNRGAFDFVTKPIDLDDLSVTIDKALAHEAILREAGQEHTQLEVLKHQLATAGRIQDALRPEGFLENDTFTIFGETRRARGIGGNVYDYFALGDAYLAFFVAKVSGQDLPAALGATICATALRTSLLSVQSIEYSTNYLNDLLCSRSGGSVVATLFLAVVDPATGTIKCVNAGHQTPYIVRPEGEIDMVAAPFGPALGTRSGVKFEVSEFNLKPGESLFVYSDGITNAINGNGQQFSIERLEDQLSAKTNESVNSLVKLVMSAVDGFVAPQKYEDDLTCLAIKRST
jgi:sigma-B regulation protein RsbU (phosphoserine phosphatase)